MAYKGFEVISCVNYASNTVMGHLREGASPITLCGKQVGSNWTMRYTSFTQHDCKRCRKMADNAPKQEAKQNA